MAIKTLENLSINLHKNYKKLKNKNLRDIEKYKKNIDDKYDSIKDIDNSIKDIPNNIKKLKKIKQFFFESINDITINKIEEKEISFIAYKNFMLCYSVDKIFRVFEVCQESKDLYHLGQKKVKNPKEAIDIFNKITNNKKKYIVDYINIFNCEKRFKENGLDYFYDNPCEMCNKTFDCDYCFLSSYKKAGASGGACTFAEKYEYRYIFLPLVSLFPNISKIGSKDTEEGRYLSIFLYREGNKEEIKKHILKNYGYREVEIIAFK